jgi:Leucine-rich repeat (LRR) protein
VLAPYEYITLVATSATDWSIISESSRFDTTKLARLNLDSNIIVRTDTLGNLDENISIMSLEKEHIATI